MGASVQEKLSNIHWKELGVRIELMKELEQNIGHGNNPSQTSGDGGSKSMIDALEIINRGNRRQSGLHALTFIPSAFLTQFEIGLDSYPLERSYDFFS